MWTQYRINNIKQTHRIEHIWLNLNPIKRVVSTRFNFNKLGIVHRTDRQTDKTYKHTQRKKEGIGKHNRHTSIIITDTLNTHLITKCLGITYCSPNKFILSMFTKYIFEMFASIFFQFQLILYRYEQFFLAHWPSTLLNAWGSKNEIRDGGQKKWQEVVNSHGKGNNNNKNVQNNELWNLIGKCNLIYKMDSKMFHIHLILVFVDERR